MKSALFPVVLSLAGSATLALPQEAVESGAIVEEVARGFAAERAGIRPGDQVVGWRRKDTGAGEGTISNPLDLGQVEAQHASAAQIFLAIIRDDQSVEIELPFGEWRISARPFLAGPQLARYDDGRRALESGDPTRATSVWNDLAEELQAGGRLYDAVWLSWRRFEALHEQASSEDADGAFAAALDLAGTLEEPLALALLWERRALMYEARRRWEPAEMAWQNAIALRRGWSGPPDQQLAIARDLLGVGTAAHWLRDLERADTLHRQALEISEASAPVSLLTAAVLQGLGATALERRDLTAASRHLAESLALTKQLAPTSLVHAESLRLRGQVNAIRGDLRAASTEWNQALQITEMLVPGTIQYSRLLSNLGIAAWYRGDLAEAERYFRSALAIVERLAPGSPEHGGYQNNLGIVYHRRFDYEQAREAYERATAIFARANPESLEVARGLTNIALTYGLSGQPEKALEYLEKTLVIQQSHNPASTDVAFTLHAMGLNYDRLDEYELAKTSYREALRMKAELAPDSLIYASTAQSLGEVLNSHGELEEAERLHTEALRLYEKLAPGTTQQGEALYGLALLFWKTGRLDKAKQHFERAIDALETQKGRLGGSEGSKSAFAVRFQHYYKDYIRLLLELDERAEAFHILERYRARGLLALLAERDLLLDRDLPEDLAQRRTALNREYDRVQGRLGRLADLEQNAATIDQTLTRLRELQQERQEIAAHVRAVSPRLASVEYPEPLRLEDAASVAEPGTAILSYCVTREGSYVFVLKAAPSGEPELAVFSIESDESSLVATVEALRVLMQAPGAGLESRRALEERSHALYRELIAPTTDFTAGSERLLIVPDGPLHQIPFAALVSMPADSQERAPAYLIQNWPVSTAISITVVAELQRRDATGAAVSGADLAAFGDPVYPTEEVGSESSAAVAMLRDRELKPLPLSRFEVEQVAALFPDHAVLYLGESATEESAKALDRRVGYVHFAAHAVVNPRFPLDSYLALTIPDDRGHQRENGLLQAWEVFEQVRIDAELATLSACETGLGADMGGEGLIGLTRAFQYAGARSVLASLWAVSDDSTSELMRHFYANLREGMRKDVALRAAQLAMIYGDNENGFISSLRSLFSREPVTDPRSHPFHWAGFQLNGLGN